jgi:hypothetical protein
MRFEQLLLTHQRNEPMEIANRDDAPWIHGTGLEQGSISGHQVRRPLERRKRTLFRCARERFGRQQRGASHGSPHQS